MDNPKTNYLNLFLIIFAFVLFISGAYYLGKQSTVVPVSAPVGVLPQTTPVPTTTIDPTTNWKTYNYTENGFNFSFKYPSIFSPKGKPSVSMVSPTDKTIIEISIEFVSSDNNNSDDLILYVNKNGNSSFEDYVGKNNDSNFTAPVITTSELGKTINWFGSYMNMTAHYHSFMKNAYIYSFGLVDLTGLPKDDVKNSQTLSQILSTFKFTER